MVSETAKRSKKTIPSKHKTIIIHTDCTPNGSVLCHENLIIPVWNTNHSTLTQDQTNTELHDMCNSRYSRINLILKLASYAAKHFAVRS